MLTLTTTDIITYNTTNKYPKWYTTFKTKCDSPTTSKNPSPKHKNNKNHESNKIA
jgi:hypothetical protein